MFRKVRCAWCPTDRPSSIVMPLWSITLFRAASIVESSPVINASRSSFCEFSGAWPKSELLVGSHFGNTELKARWNAVLKEASLIKVVERAILSSRRFDRSMRLMAVTASKVSLVEMGTPTALSRSVMLNTRASTPNCVEFTPEAYPPLEYRRKIPRN